MGSHLDIGLAFSERVLPALSRAQLALYAGASGDHVPLHIDTDYARRAGMPDVFGHGMFTVAWLGVYLTAHVEQDRVRRLDLRFTGVMHLYNQPVCRGQVVGHEDVDGERCARIELQVTNQYGESKVLAEALVALN